MGKSRRLEERESKRQMAEDWDVTGKGIEGTSRAAFILKGIKFDI